MTPYESTPLAVCQKWSDSLTYTIERVRCLSLSLISELKTCLQFVFDGKNVFVWLPTGFGKSICYKVLLLMFDKKPPETTALVVFIVLLLVSLMVDQVHSLCVSEGPYVLVKDVHSRAAGTSQSRRVLARPKIGDHVIIVRQLYSASSLYCLPLQKTNNHEMAYSQSYCAHVQFIHT